MTIDQLSRALHQKFSVDEKAQQGCFFIDARSHPNVSFMIIDGRVVRVDVTTPGVKTTTGIQVGDSEARALAKYGSKMRVTPHTYTDTGHYLTVGSAEDRYGIRFETDRGTITMFYAGEYKAIQYVEGCE